MSDTADKEILNIEEAARFLGVSVKTFNKVLHSETLPARKIGREWKFSRRALIAWVGEGRSHDFYKESAEHHEAVRETVRPGGVAGNGRRTSGWRIELD